MSGVGARTGYVPLHKDGSSKHGFDDRGVKVAAFEFNMIEFVVVGQMVFSIKSSIQRGRRE